MAVEPQVIVLGSVNTDLVIRGPKLPLAGETVLGGQFFQAQGGKGANQAVAAARVSQSPVLFIASVGDDAFGQQALESLEREGILIEYITRSPGPTGVALILVDGTGQNLIGVASGANWTLRPADVERVPDRFFRQAKVFLASLESPMDAVARGLTRAREAGLVTILNPAPAEPGAKACFSLVDVLTPNEGEAATLAFGSETRNRSDSVAAARELRRLGCRQVIVTLGREGCMIVGEDVDAIPGRAIEAIDATAAGDCFNGALAVALAEGRSLSAAARFANAAASVSVTRAGAQPSLPTREEIPD